MQDKVLFGIIHFLVYQFYCTAELAGAGKQGTVGHPKYIAGLFCYDVSQSAAQGNFNFLDFIEYKKAEFLVEPIKFDGSIKTATLLKNLPVFRNFKKWVEVCA